ncbi:P-loop containing nucleoside triphosphate hydrolase protein [Hypoxylon trugodes]|uniref:P-loop containing nucleoside triphosphate hydrolase protein n=1 Tax=Hypoxylon trugodes TaxID=326681 RepID=UPI0021974C6A|nr:P-loop containing nucleoside triphosphate hydrolase protein [Hypoxylon trugodes]KAI1383407.1 P-loop containing nucleoside triphosphate hydrolase protein [Hypoxylon trugodes]
MKMAYAGTDYYYDSYYSRPSVGGGLDSPEASLKSNPPGLVGNWYQHICEGHCPMRWSAFKDFIVEQEDLMARTSDSPIIHRHVQRDGVWVTLSISIQDPDMREILNDVLKDYPEFDPKVENWTFEPPYQPLVHRWDNLQQYDTEDLDVRKALTSMLIFLTPIVNPTMLSLGKLRESGKIDYQNIWHLFAPGTLVIAKLYGVDTISRANRCDRMSGFWLVRLEYIDWNGDISGYETATQKIKIFEGYQLVTKLEVFPISYLDNEAGVRKTATEKGRKFEQLRGYRYVEYNGTKVMIETDKPHHKQITGRVCLDAYAYYNVLSISKRTLRPSPGGEERLPNTEYGKAWNLPHKSRKALQWEAYSGPLHEAKHSPNHKHKDNEILCPLTEEELLITNPWLIGFDLKAKDFGKFHIDNVKEVTWNDEAYDKLVLPNREKELTWSFVKGKHRANETKFDDFIQKKGRGLIILLFGPPGVGKTFTAEAVAEKSKVPLYAMSASDLGIKPREMEKALERALKLCHLWDAMFLLDEADVYLSARGDDSLSRNELVCIFLRLLEYYEGTLFLTTNRATQIDHAFQSRIDLFLPYQDLGKDVRRKIWANFLERTGNNGFPVVDEMLDKLAEIKLNGREIKNLIKSAHMLVLGSDDDDITPLERLYMLAQTHVQAIKGLNL